MGQFHVDFDLDGCKPDKIKSVESIFLGKKSYYNVLEGINGDGKIVEGKHSRMKGIPSQCFKDQLKGVICECWETRDGKKSSYQQSEDSIRKLVDRPKTLYEMYERLANGEEFTVDLLEGGKGIFHKNNGIS